MTSPKDFYTWPPTPLTPPNLRNYNAYELHSKLHHPGGRYIVQCELLAAIKHYLHLYPDQVKHYDRVGRSAFKGIADIIGKDENSRWILGIRQMMNDSQHRDRDLDIYYRAYRFARRELRHARRQK